jgi:hypothetical protein
MAHGMTHPGFGGKSAGNSDNGKGKGNTAKDKSGFGGAGADPGLRSLFVDAVKK